MSSSTTKIFFYIPEKEFPSILPDKKELFWQWHHSTEFKYYSGKYNWTLQTYLALKSTPLQCVLTSTLPDAGLIIAHRDFLPFHLKPNFNQFLVCIQADRPVHPYAQVHLVQNPLDEKLLQRNPLWQSQYIPFWSQPGLIPRRQERGARLENVVFLGIRHNLDPQLKSPKWQEQLAKLGLVWKVVPRSEWNDYSEIDVVIAVRRFDYQGEFLRKPPSKLVNGWLAGVPVIVGQESAYQALYQSEKDYIEVTSIDETLDALKQLRDDHSLWQEMVENGHRRAQAYTHDTIKAQWQEFLTAIAIPGYLQWQAASQIDKQCFLWRRYMEIRKAGIQRRLSAIIPLISKPSQDSTWD